MANVYCIMKNHDWEKPNLIDGLEQAGHNVVGHYDWGEETSKRKIFLNIFKSIELYIQEHGKNSIDLLFFYISGKQITADNLRVIRDAFQIPMLNISCNDMTNWRKGSMPVAAEFDYCWTMTRNALPKFKGLNDNVFALPLAVNTTAYQPCLNMIEHDVIFIGSPITDRLDYINHLRSNGINVKVFSSHSNSRPLTTEDMCAAYSASKIALSFTKMADGHEVRLRNFEIPPTYTMQISEYCEELKDYFNDDEIVMFKTKEELLEKVKYYLDSDEERARIQKAAAKRVLRDHSWQVRYAQVFDNLRKMGFKK